MRNIPRNPTTQAPAPTIVDQPSDVLTLLGTLADDTPQLTLALVANGLSSLTSIASAAGCSEVTAHRTLQDLLRAALVTFDGTSYDIPPYVGARILADVVELRIDVPASGKIAIERPWCSITRSTRHAASR